MVSRALHDVTDSIADAFTLQTQRQRSRDEMLRQLEEVRRMATYNRHRLIRERHRSQSPISSEDIEAAVIRAIKSSKSEDQ